MSIDALTVFSTGYPDTVRRTETAVLSRALPALPDNAWVDRAWSLAHILYLDADAFAGFASVENPAYIARLTALRERAPAGAILDIVGSDAAVHVTVGLPDGTVVTESWDGRGLSARDTRTSLEEFCARTADTLTELFSGANSPDQSSGA